MYLKKTNICYVIAMSNVNYKQNAKDASNSQNTQDAQNPQNPQNTQNTQNIQNPQNILTNYFVSNFVDKNNTNNYYAISPWSGPLLLFK